MYVDDLLVLTVTEKGGGDFVSKIARVFKIKDLGELRKFLGIEFEWQGRRKV